MSTKFRLLLTFLLVTLVTSTLVTRGMAEDGSAVPQTAIIMVSDNAITFEVTVPVENLALQIVQQQDQSYTEVSLPGFSSISDAGSPQLPFLTEVIGAPFESEISVSVKPGSMTRIKLSEPVLPAASRDVIWDYTSLADELASEPVVTTTVQPNPEFYQGNAIFPVELGSVANDAIFRSQRLVSIALYPIRYDPSSNELLVVDQLEVTVAFAGESRQTQAGYRTDTAFFEEVLKSNLLNYEQAKNWREHVSADLGNNLMASQTPWAPPDPGWRVKVRETGFYKLTFAELLAAGIPIDSIDIDTLKMFYLGEEIAIKVIPGESVLFYGEAIDSKYTSDNVYWITYGGGAGLRMQSVDGMPTADPIALSYPHQEHHEKDLLYRSKATGSDDLERYFWGTVYRSGASVVSWSQSFSLADRYDGDLSLSITLIGYSSVVPINPDHHGAISINGTQVAEVFWDGYSNLVVDIDIPASLLLPGTNTLQVTALPIATDADLFFIDSFDLAYAHTFSSASGRLDFSSDTPGDWQFLLTDFPSATIEVYDVSEALTPKRIENIQITGVDTSFSAQFHDQISSPKNYLALDQSKYLPAYSIEKDNPSNLASHSNGSDYLMISHKDFVNAAAALQTQKTAQGLRTRLMDVQDIYDEFGYGIVDVYAIRNFIAYAYTNWAAPAPTYVLLIGDGHSDPKNHFGYGRTSFIPPFLAAIDPDINETAADNRYVSILGEDTFPDLMLGRLSVNTAAEAQTVIDKIVAYETDYLDSDWKKHILAIADKPDYPPDPPAHYPLISEMLLWEFYPSDPYSATEVFWQWTHYDLQQARSAIQNAFNEGVFLVNFVGHGYYGGWTNSGLFNTNDLASLQPQTKLPIILAMTCMEGYYISPALYSSKQEAMGEMITRLAGKGAVASWSPTGWGSVNGHDVLDRGFFKAVYKDDVNLISQATTTGLLSLWATGENLDLLDTFLLFGDPAMRMNLSLKTMFLPLITKP